MHNIRKIAAKTPLFIRAVSLYVLCALVFIGLQISIFGNSTASIKVQAIKKPVIEKVITISKKVISGEPTTFQVTRLNINLPVSAGTYDSTTGDWTLSNDSVYFAKMTNNPNDQRGNTFFYGHNNQQVLGRMSDIAVGDIAEITTTNGHTFKYVYNHDDIVPPDLTSVLYDNPEKPRLTIMTCEGIWSQARRLMYFDFQEVN